MKLKYEATKGKRIKYGFTGFQANESGWWYNMTLNKWGKYSDTSHNYSSHQQCRTVKAFYRKLKSAPIGVAFTLTSRWVGYDVYGIGH